MTQKWYRIEDKRFANYDPWAEYDQPKGSHTEILIHEFVLVKKTPKGVWIQLDYGKGNGLGEKRFVLDAATKRYADPTIELAFKSFVARKRKQADIYHNRAKIAEQAMGLALVTIANQPKYKVSKNTLLENIRGPSVLLTSELDSVPYFTSP